MVDPPPTRDFLFGRRYRAISWGILLAALIAALTVADDRTRPLLVNTLLFAGGAALLSLPLGTLLALLITRTDLPARRLLLGLTTLMIFVPPYLTVAGWEAGFGLQGWFCRYWFPERAIALLAGWRGALWIQTLVNIPWVVLIVSAGCTTIPGELEEQASLYCSPWRVLQCVTLRLLTPALSASGLAVFVLAANEITVTDVFQIRTFAEEIYTGFALGDQLYDVPLRTLPGILLVAGLAIASLLACSQLAYNLTAVTRSRAWHAPLGLAPLPIWGVLAGLLACVVVVPVASLVYQAGLQVLMQEGVRQRHWLATKAILTVLGSPMHFRQEFAWSFALAQLTSPSVLAAAATLAWMSRSSRLVRTLCWAFVLAGLALPGPMLALLFGRALNRPDSDWLFYLYDRTIFLPWFTLSVRLFPFAYIIMEIVVRRLSQRHIELAQLEGASRVQLFRLAVWPQIAPTIGWLWLILMALSMGDLSATVLAVPPGVTTVAIRIFNLVHYGVADQLAGLCLGTLMLFGGVACLVIALWPGRFGMNDHRV